MSDQAIEEAIQAAGANVAPRITPADIEASIVSESYFTSADGVVGSNTAVELCEALGEVAGIRKRQDLPYELNQLTFCVLVLRNGFTVTGESACASPENFNAEIGRKVARDNAIAKVWPLIGYELKERLYQSALPPVAPVLTTYVQRMAAELEELNTRLNKLTSFIGTAPFLALASIEQADLRAQQTAMQDYSFYLNRRLSRASAVAPT